MQKAKKIVKWKKGEDTKQQTINQMQRKQKQ